MSKNNARRTRPRSPIDRKMSRLTAQVESGLMTIDDSDLFYREHIVPVLARAIGARTLTMRGMAGREGSFHRNASRPAEERSNLVYTVQGARTVSHSYYVQSAEYVCDIEISHQHMLTEPEVISQWGTIERSGAADTLVANASSLHASAIEDPMDFDTDDPDVITSRLEGQLIDLEMYDDADEEEFTSLIYGSDIRFYFDRMLRVVYGKRPVMMFGAGYLVDGQNYPLSVSMDSHDKLTGDTPGELFAIDAIREASQHHLDGETMREFYEALVVVDILKRVPKN